MKVQVLCHSSIRIETNHKIIYCDPFKIRRDSHDADIILITHSHYDHFSEEDILKIRKENTKIVITSDLKEKTIHLGFQEKDIIEVNPNQEYEVLEIKIHTIPAYNINKQFHPKENNWVGYLLIIEGQAIYIAGDTDITEENKKVKCDIALVPIGGTYTMTPEEAAQLINTIKPKKVIPTHYGEIVGTRGDANIFKELVRTNCEVEIQI